MTTALIILAVIAVWLVAGYAVLSRVGRILRACGDKEPRL